MNKISSLSEKEALQKAMRICSTQEKCTNDIIKKLQLWGIAFDKFEEIINKLVEDKFIDNERYTMFFVKDKFRLNKWGRIKIRYHLKQKNIPDDVINKALTQISDQDYKDAIKDLLVKKQQTFDKLNEFKKRVKLIRYAESKGFEIDEIIKIVDALNNKK